MRSSSYPSRLLKTVSAAKCESGRKFRSGGSGGVQGFLATSSSLWLFLEVRKKNALAVRIRGGLCPSLETEGAVTWQKWKEDQCGLCCLWAKHITVVDIFNHYLYYLSFVPSAAPPAKDFIYVCAVRASQVSVLRSRPVKLSWKMSLLSVTFGVKLFVEGCLWDAEGYLETCAHKGLSVKAGRSWLCLFSEHLMAARYNQNILFSAVLKATVPYHLPEY